MIRKQRLNEEAHNQNSRSSSVIFLECLIEHTELITTYSKDLHHIHLLRISRL